MVAVIFWKNHRRFKKVDHELEDILPRKDDKPDKEPVEYCILPCWLGRLIREEQGN
jgi:hypothetical protein